MADHTRTGASAGIGAACAWEFAAAGSHLILAARRLDRLNDLKSQITLKYPSVKVLPLSLDVCDSAKIKSSVESLPNDFKNVHVLVNNAGLIIGMDTVETVTESVVNTVLDTNVKGLLFMTQAILPIMKKNNAGNIINISSIAGHEVYPGGGLYCASKHAVDAFTRTLRMELVNTNINVTSIDPGLVETEFSLVRFEGDADKAKKVYQGLEALKGQDVAEAVVFAASRPPHVQIGTLSIFPTSQAAVHVIYRSS